jgi:hypothetical protein
MSFESFLGTIPIVMMTCFAQLIMPGLTSILLTLFFPWVQWQVHQATGRKRKIIKAKTKHPVRIVVNDMQFASAGAWGRFFKNTTQMRSDLNF